jgi:hypothetical protein
MLFCYPIQAIQDNWLHDCIMEILRAALGAMNLGESLIPWPDNIPATYRNALRRRYGLRQRLNEFLDLAATLSNDERNVILASIASQNDIPQVFDGHTSCICCSGLPEAVNNSADELVRFSFALLTDLGIRDKHYRLIYNNIPGRLCPFCGYEYFDHPEAPRHHLDHFLPISRYPFAGANLRNLVPAGDRCNSAYKRDTDILIGEDGHQRACFDPYGGHSATVSLKGSRLFARREGRLPEWYVDFGNDPAAATWDAVWHINERYRRDVLDAEFADWLAHFAQWCRRSNREAKTASEIIVDLNEYVLTVIQEGYTDRAFLKRAMFEMMISQAEQPESSQRVSEFLIDLISADLGAGA